MTKVIKLKQSDVVKIVESVLKEQGGPVDDFDTTAAPEESPEAANYEFAVGKGDDGQFYIIKGPKGDSPKLVARTK